MRIPFAGRRRGTALESAKRRPSFRRFIADRRGDTAILAAAAMPAVIGFFGLGVEVGHWYLTKVELQSAADAAAVAGAAVRRAGGSQAEIEAAALRAALETGFDGQAGVLVVNAPPLTGGFTGTPAVEVTAAQSRKLLFAAMFMEEAVVPNARAVALPSPGRPVCVLALDASAPAAVNFDGTSDVNMNGCEIVSNSIDAAAFTLTGSAKLRADCVSAVGGASTSSGLTLTGCRAPVEGIAPVRDPYAGVPEPSAPTACTPSPSSSPKTTITLDPARYCGGLTLKGSVTLNAGTYIVDGGSLTIEASAVVAGSGITFFLTNGATVRIAGTASVNLSAPTTGPYAGLLFFGDRDNPVTGENILAGSSTSSFEGAIYFPSQTLEYTGNSGASGTCAQIVARKVMLKGTTRFDGSCPTTGMQQMAGRPIRIVE
jgi:hypothetical protein